MERHKFWIFLGLAVALGACLEVLKTPAPDHTRMAGFGKFTALLDEGRAVVGVPEKETELGITVASNNLNNDADDEEDDDSDEVAAADGAKPGVTAAGKKADPKKADAKKKKKKKKKKVADKKTDPAVQQAEALAKAAADAAEAKKKAATVADAANQGPTPLAPDDPNTPPPSTTQTAAPTNIPETAAEWEKYLMVSPSYAKTSHFIKYRQSGLVTSQTFYAVTTAMLASKLSTPVTSSETTGSQITASTQGALIQSYGVLALGSSPDATSFRMLSEYTEGAGVDASIRGQAQVYIQTYGQLKYVHYLATVLSSSADVNTKTQAITLVQTAAQAAFSTQSQSTGSTTNTAASAQQTFLPFVSLLTTIANSAGTGNTATSTSALQTAAQGALTTLHTFGLGA